MDSDSSVHGIEREKNKSTYKKTPSDNEGKNLRATRSVAGTVEPDMAQGSVLHMAKTCNCCQRRNRFQSVYRSLKKVRGLDVEQQEEEHDLDSTLSVGAVTAEVQIQNEECYVMLPVKGQTPVLKSTSYH